MNVIISVVLILSLGSVKAAFPFQKTKYFKMERLEYCANDSSNDISVKNAKMFFRKNVLQFGGSFYIQKVIDNSLQFDVILIRCKSINHECVTFQNNTYKHMCDILYETKLFGANFISMITPEMQCPIKIGLYKLNTAEINLDFLTALPIDGFLWNIQVNLYVVERAKRKMVACIAGHVRVLQGGTRRKGR